MRCNDVYQFICDNLDQSIDSPGCAAIRMHLESCEDCRAYLDSLKQTIQLYRTEPSPAMPAAVHRRLMTAIRDCMGRPAPAAAHRARRSR